MSVLVLVLAKILIITSIVGLLRCSSKYRRMSRELDDHALTALKRIMHAAEDCGYPAYLVPLLILLTTVYFMLSSYYVTGAVVR